MKRAVEEGEVEVAEDVVGVEVGDKLNDLTLVQGLVEMYLLDFKRYFKSLVNIYIYICIDNCCGYPAVETETDEESFLAT